LLTYVCGIDIIGIRDAVRAGCPGSAHQRQLRGREGRVIGLEVRVCATVAWAASLEDSQDFTRWETYPLRRCWLSVHGCGARAINKEVM